MRELGYMANWKGTEITPENWERVKCLFQSALDLEVEQRPAFLKQNCTDPSLRAEVERLLANDGKAGGFLADPVVGGLAPALAESHLPLLAAGTVLAGRFRIIRFVAEGGMGEVYEAEDLELHERLGIKTLRSEVLQQPNAIERFKREVQLARKVSHPNVCRIFDLYRDKSNGSEVVFVTMEFLRGETLAERIKHQGRMDTQEALPLITQMASALGAAHQVGIVHRDFKPGNVVLVNGATEARAVVTDFGLAFREVNIAEHSQSGPLWHSISAPGMSYGTPAYMAPEQVEGRPATSASDIYALGLVMYEMVTGARPFTGDTPMSAAVRRLVEPPPTPRKFDPKLSPVWEFIILKCLEREPDKRFRTPQEVVNSLSDVQVPMSKYFLRRVVTRRTRRWILATAVALVICLLLALAGAIWYLSRPLPPPRITEYTQITHDGRRKLLAGTDGSRLYFTRFSPTSVAQVGVKGGEISDLPVSIPRLKGLMDISPDGSNALLSSFQSRDADGAWVVPILGGAAKRLPDGSANFSPDGDSVVYTTVGGDIFMVRTDGTETHKLASVPAHTNAFNFRWSPDGKVIRFSKDSPVSSDSPFKLWEMSADGTGMHPLLSSGNKLISQWGGTWTPDGNFYVFNADTQIWALAERRGLFRKAPSLPIQLTNGPIDWGRPIPSRDGTKIFAVGATVRGELSLIDPKTGNLQPFLGGISAEFATFSPDGNYVAYASFPEDTLWRANRDGSNRMQLTGPTAGCVLNPRWSPDSKQIAYMTLAPDNHSQIHRISAADGSPQWLPLDEDIDMGDPNWSPDGTKVVFSTSSTYVPGDIRIADLKSRQVSILPGSQGKLSPRWSPDGRNIAALSFRQGNRLSVFDLKLQRWFDLTANGEVEFPNFSHDGKFIYFFRPRQGVFRIPLTGGREESVVDTKNLRFTGHLGFSLTLDPSDAPLVTRDVSTVDIYALTLREK
jgi:serine/threonine protein kinase/Tol biopolymer transport system component